MLRCGIFLLIFLSFSLKSFSQDVESEEIPDFVYELIFPDFERIDFNESESTIKSLLYSDLSYKINDFEKRVAFENQKILSSNDFTETVKLLEIEKNKTIAISKVFLTDLITHSSIYKNNHNSELWDNVDLEKLIQSVSNVEQQERLLNIHFFKFLSLGDINQKVKKIAPSKLISLLSILTNHGSKLVRSLSSTQTFNQSLFTLDFIDGLSLNGLRIIKKEELTNERAEFLSHSNFSRDTTFERQEELLDILKWIINNDLTNINIDSKTSCAKGFSAILNSSKNSISFQNKIIDTLLPYLAQKDVHKTSNVQTTKNISRNRTLTTETSKLLLAKSFMETLKSHGFHSSTYSTIEKRYLITVIKIRSKKECSSFLLEDGI